MSSERSFRFYFDFSCPYAYVASTQVEALAERTGARLDARPILLGGIFRAVDTPQNLSEVLGAAKARHNAADMQRQARLFDVPLEMPAAHPMRTVEALRALLVVGEPYFPLAHAFFEAYWVRGEPLSDRTVLARILSEHGHDADAVLAKIDDPEIKDELRARTDEGLEAGVFGVPAYVVEDQFYWGVDRMPWVEAQLEGVPATVEGPAEGLLYPVDVYYDYSSPFAYVGCARARVRLGAAARWRPMLLGALFKQVGTPNVPLFEQSESKRRHTGWDLDRQTALAGLPYRFPTRFPMRTVLPLRMTLLAERDAPDRAPALVDRIFRAMWGEDRDIADPEVVAALANEVGFDGADLVRRAQEPPAKLALRETTNAALEAGVFGTPTFVVHTPAGPELFWGADRLDLAVRAAQGDTTVCVMTQADA